MKIASKTKQRLFLFAFVVLTILGLLVRFMNYSNLVNFHLDPPLFMHDVKDMVDSGKIRLVGPPVVSKEVYGREFFTGPFHYYILAILGVVSGWNITLMSAFYTLLWMFTFILIFYWFRKKFGNAIAILIYGILVFYPPFVVMSRGMWNPHFVPLFGVLFLMFLVERKKPFHYFLAGLFAGLGINAHYSALLFIPVAGFFLIDDIRRRRFNIKNWALFLLGAILAEFPFILFELRHNFYNLRTVIFQVKYGSLSRGYTFTPWYYYLFPLLPVISYLFAVGLNKIRKTRFFRVIVVALMALMVYLLVTSFGSAGQKPMYPTGWNIARQREVARIIKEDSKGEFEVAETINSDTRALDIRWWLRMSGVNVMDVTKYDIAPVLYLVATEKRPPEKETVWEVSTMRPFKVEFKDDVGGGLFLYKLVRQ